MDPSSSSLDASVQTYRHTNPLLSSSPSGARDGFLTPPSSSSPPASPTLRFARITSNNDPFSAASKAEPSQHPQFGKPLQPFTKHSMGPPMSNSALRSRGQPFVDQSSDSDFDGSIKATRDRVFDRFFESSDDNPVSDDHLDTIPWDQSSDNLDSESSGVGLGLGRLGSGNDSVVSPRLSTSKASAGRKRSAFQRHPSVSDPFGGFQTAPRDPRPSSSSISGLATSPRPSKPAQRRRLIGTSPKKLSTSWNHETSDSEEEGIAGLVKSTRSPQNLPRTWHKIVESVFDSNETAIDISDRQITDIHPVVADLAKFVAIDPPRFFESTPSTSSLPSRTDSMHRIASSRTPFSRTSTSAVASFSSPSRPSAASSESVRGAGRGNLQLYMTNNGLTKLPSALFQVGNLRVLGLRNNNLTILPSAIGELANLRELNVAGNQLKYLPAEIQKLSLEQFHFWPNRFLEPPEEAELQIREVLAVKGAQMSASPSALREEKEEDEMTVAFLRQGQVEDEETTHASPSHSNDTCKAEGSQVARYLGPIRVPTSALPSLRELCIRRLLSPMENDSCPPSPNQSMVTSPSVRSPMSPRKVVFTRIPSSSSAFKYQYKTGQRPLTVLETYENGALRDLESDAQMEASTISVLESARRSMDSKWGSGNSALSTASGAPRASLSFNSSVGLGTDIDSWCKGATGITRESSRDGEVAADADDSSFSDSDRAEAADGTMTTSSMNMSPLLAFKGKSLAAAFAIAPRLDVSSQLDTQGDDATANPHFNRCPNPLHLETFTLARECGINLPPTQSASNHKKCCQQTCNSPPTSTSSLPSGPHIDFPIPAELTPFCPLYESSIESRIEWVSHIGGSRVLRGSGPISASEGQAAQGSGVLPILWRGCSKGCLAFLESAALDEKQKQDDDEEEGAQTVTVVLE